MLCSRSAHAMHGLFLWSYRLIYLQACQVHAGTRQTLFSQLEQTGCKSMQGMHMSTSNYRDVSAAKIRCSVPCWPAREGGWLTECHVPCQGAFHSTHPELCTPFVLCAQHSSIISYLLRNALSSSVCARPSLHSDGVVLAVVVSSSTPFLQSAIASILLQAKAL